MNHHHIELIEQTKERRTYPDQREGSGAAPFAQLSDAQRTDLFSKMLKERNQVSDKKLKRLNQVDRI